MTTEILELPASSSTSDSRMIHYYCLACGPIRALCSMTPRDPELLPDTYEVECIVCAEATMCPTCGCGFDV